jgi:uncharacterized protein (TIGR03083 family)
MVDDLEAPLRNLLASGGIRPHREPEEAMETNPGPWIDALRHSHDRLEAIVEPLDAGQLEQPAYPSKWSIAQVLSHLGSQAEIFGLWLDASLSGTEPPGRDVFGPIWDSWNARSPQAQAADGLHADQVTLERMESLDADQLARLHLNLFGMELDATGLGRIRLGEHAVHTWDVAVALDPKATVAPDAVGLLIDTLGPFIGRVAKPDGVHRRLRVVTTDPERDFILAIGESVTLTPADGDAGLPELWLPAEAFIRLAYGRLDPAHTPAVQASGVDLDELRVIFPGF